MNKFKLLYLNTYITILIVDLFLRTSVTSFDSRKKREVVHIQRFSYQATQLPSNS